MHRTPCWRARWSGTCSAAPRASSGGRDNLRDFVKLVFATQPALRRRYRTGFFTDGKRLMWEYPREAPDGPQMDLVEVMDIADGLIQRHRVYWGWLGLKVLEEDGHRPT